MSGINYSTIATSNLKDYMTYATRMSDWDVFDLDTAVVTINGSKQSLFNYVFCKDGIDDHSVKQILSFLRDKGVEATWPVDSCMKKMRATIANARLIQASAPQKAFLPLKNYMVQRELMSLKLTLEEVDSAEKLKKFDESTSVIFHHDINLLRTFVRGLEKPEVVVNNKSLKYFLVLLDNEVVGTCGLYMQDKVAGFYGDGILPKYRNRGLATQMLLRRIELAIACECDFAVAHCMKPSVNLYKRLGFKMLGNLFLYVSSV